MFFVCFIANKQENGFYFSVFVLTDKSKKQTSKSVLQFLCSRQNLNESFPRARACARARVCVRDRERGRGEGSDKRFPQKIKTGKRTSLSVFEINFF